jgi:hypothetical protein
MHSKTFDHISAKKNSLALRLTHTNQEKDEIIGLYAEGISALKRYELHPKLSKDPKKQQHLIDIYYSESSMNNFKASVIS